MSSSQAKPPEESCGDDGSRRLSLLNRLPGARRELIEAPSAVPVIPVMILNPLMLLDNREG